MNPHELSANNNSQYFPNLILSIYRPHPIFSCSILKRTPDIISFHLHIPQQIFLPDEVLSYNLTTCQT